jgi:hypothetical protein
LNLLAKINRSTEKYHFLLKRALTIIIGLLYLQLTDHGNVTWAVDIIIFMQGFPETWELFQGFLQGKKIEKGCRRLTNWVITVGFLSYGKAYVYGIHKGMQFSHRYHSSARHSWLVDSVSLLLQCNQSHSPSRNRAVTFHRQQQRLFLETNPDLRQAKHRHNVN